jgi:hypothetical protein
MKRCITAIGLFFSFTLQAQVEQDLRLEIEINSSSDNYFVIPTGSYGMVLFGENETDNKQTTWEFTFYDRDLKKVSNSSMEIESRFYYYGYYFDDDKSVYVFFNNPRDDQYELVTVNAESRKVTSKTGALPKKFYMDKFKVYKIIMYIAGTIKKSQFLGGVNLSDMSMIPYPINYDGDNEVKNIDISSKDEEVNIVVSNLLKKSGLMYVQTFKDGKRILETPLTPKDGYNLLDGKVNHVDKDTKVVIGTYAIGKGGASGIYYCKLVDNQQTSMKYYNFSDFTNFFNYLSDKSKEKVEKKIEQAKEKGKEYDLSYSLLVHDLIQQNGELILVAEAYYPTYRTEYYTTTVADANGSMHTVNQSRQVFDGYRYSHAVVAGFDGDGIKQWDNTFEMGDFKSFLLSDRIAVKVNPDGDIQLVYGFGSELRSKTIVGNKVIDKKQAARIENDNPDSKIKSSTVSDIAVWYGDYFLASGYQTIKDDEKGKKKHKVFYFTRLKYV